jgi:uncharacterized protein (DUF1778 family)
MKKIECHISDDKSEVIDKICEINGYTRAEFNRRLIDEYLDRPLKTEPAILNSIKSFAIGHV